MTEMKQKTLLRALDVALLWASKDVTRPHISQVLFEPMGADGLRLVATDGHGIAMIDAPCEMVGASVEVSRLHVVQMRKLLATQPKARRGQSETCELACLPRIGGVEPHVALTIEGLPFKAPATRGGFPPYRKFMSLPDVEPVKSFYMTGCYIELVGKTFPEGLSVRARGELDPVTFDGPICDGVTAKVVVMTRRGL